MTSLYRRTLLGLGSNAYGQAVTVTTQLLSVPFFLAHWPLERYGQWLVLSAIPAYFSAADLGLVTVAGSEMTMSYARGHKTETNRIFHSAQFFVLGVCAAIFACVTLAAVVLGPETHVTTTENAVAVLLLIFGVLAAQIGGLAEAAYTATGRYAVGNAMSGTARLVEWAGGLVGLYVFGSFVGVAGGGLCGRIIMVAAAAFFSLRSEDALTWGLTSASTAKVRSMLRPAAGVMSFTLSNAVGLQGLTIVCGAVLGGAATAIFNTYRTLARTVVQLNAMLSHSLWPEFSALQGRGEQERLKRIYRRALGLGAMGSVLSALAVLLAAKLLLHGWTRGRIHFSMGLITLFLIYAVVSSAWLLSRALLLSANKHATLSIVVLIVNVVVVVTAWPSVQLFGLPALPVVMIAGELASMITSQGLAQKSLEKAPTAPGVRA